MHDFEIAQRILQIAQIDKSGARVTEMSGKVDLVRFVVGCSI